MPTVQLHGPARTDALPVEGWEAENKTDLPMRSMERVTWGFHLFFFVIPDKNNFVDYYYLIIFGDY